MTCINVLLHKEYSSKHQDMNKYTRVAAYYADINFNHVYTSAGNRLCHGYFDFLASVLHPRHMLAR